VITATISGLDVTIKNIGKLSEQGKKGAYDGVFKALDVANQACEKMISADDHSLAELALMGHPYSAAHPDPPHSDPIIHVVTGDYQRGLVTTPPVGWSDAIISGTIKNDDPKDRWLQDGTVNMIARPYMEWVIQTIGTGLRDLIIANIMRGVERGRDLFHKGA